MHMPYGRPLLLLLLPVSPRENMVIRELIQKFSLSLTPAAAVQHQQAPLYT
jgi:hypothetical protein